MPTIDPQAVSGCPGAMYIRSLPLGSLCKVAGLHPPLRFQLLRVSPAGAYVQELSKRGALAIEDVFLDDFSGGRAGRYSVSNATIVEPIPFEEAVSQQERGGKPVAEMLRPLTPGTKRERIIQAAASGMKVTDIMTEFGVTRSCALSHLNDAQKFNGIGYKLNANGSIEITYPQQKEEEHASGNQERRAHHSGEDRQEPAPVHKRKVAPLGYFRRQPKH